MNFDWYVSITHGATTNTYYNEAFPSLAVTGKENDVSCAVLTGAETIYKLYPDTIDKLDNLKIYVKKYFQSTYTEIFDGTIRDITEHATTTGNYLSIKCKGLGEALEETHCSTNYGYTSQNNSIDTVEEIIEDLVDNYINKSYGSANNTGYTITKTYIPTIDAGLSIPFINAPYQTNKTLIDLVCNLDTAYRDGGTAGPHYFVDVSGNLRIKTIGTQQVDGGGGAGDWGIYCGGSNNAVELKHGRDFLTYSLNVPTDMYANSTVVYATLRKPAYDYLTESGTSGGSTLWGNDSAKTVTDDVATYIVGADSLDIETNGANQCYVYTPSTEDAGWDITKWGSPESIPRINFYYQKDANILEQNTWVMLCTTDHKTDFFYATFCNWYTDPDNQWIHISLPIGPYYRTNLENKQFRWSSSGAPDWTDINCVGFGTSLAGGDGHLYIDDLHFTGKIAREAVDTSEVTSYKERQHPIISKVALDDSAITSDDTGMAGSIAYAELLRRVNIPRNINFDIELRPELKPGEHFKIYVGKTPTTYKINGVDFRVLTYTHKISTQGATTTINATDDVLNSFPINKIDQRNVLNEFLLENNEKATDMKGVDVDLLVEHMRKTY